MLLGGSRGPRGAPGRATTLPYLRARLNPPAAAETHPVTTPDFPPFRPRAPWRGPDLQTLRNVVRGPVMPLPEEAQPVRLKLPMADGSGDVLAARAFSPLPGAPERPDAPTVVVVHGLGGSEDSAYLGVTTAHLLSEGFRVIQMNLRGAGPSRPTCQQQYHAGRTADFRDALAAIPQEWTQNGVAAVGFSLGGNMVLKYAAEFGGLRAVASVSAPIDLSAASYRFLDARNRFYHTYLLAGMKREALGEGAAVTDEERRILPDIRTILEFDEKIVAPRGGFKDAADYYAQNNARQFLAAIRLPALLIHAQDDPWIPSIAYTSYDWTQNRNLTPLLPKGGGHVGFHGAGERVPWHDRCIAKALANL